MAIINNTLLVLVGLAAIFRLSKTQAVVAIEGAGMTRIVSEANNFTEVCVTISNAEAGDSATFTIRTVASGDRTGVDFVSLSEQRTLNDSVTRTCVDVVILQNGIETGISGRDFNVILIGGASQGNVGVNDGDGLTIAIQDIDEVIVGFRLALYEVVEGQAVAVCVDLVEGLIDSAITIRLTHRLTPSLGKVMVTTDDFELTNSSRSDCISFGTSSNNLIEGSVFQTLTLMVREIPVGYSLNKTIVEVKDMDVATLEVVGNTSISLLEGNFNSTSTVTLCLSLVGVSGGLRRDIVVNVTTVEGSATVAGKDFAPVVAVLTIPSESSVAGFSSSEFCVNVSVLGDEVRELNETFMVYFNAQPDIFRGPDRINFTILNDGDVNDCTILLSPVNGMVSFDGTVLGSVANYTCVSERFRIVPEGSDARTCGDDNWEGEDPVCAAVCESLSLTNGMVVFSSSTNFIMAGNKATHVCHTNFRLDGNSERTCQDDGFWSGSEPTCRAISCSRLSNPPDGSVIHGGTSVGDLVRYSCNRGFNLKGGGAGGDTRVCSTDGTWTGTAPICRSGASLVTGNVMFVLVAAAIILSTVFHNNWLH